MGFEDELRAEIRRRRGARGAVDSVVDEYYLEKDSLGEDEEAFRERLRDIKKRAIENLESLVEQAKESFEKRGVSVLLAKDAREARGLVGKILGEDKNIVKSKSNTCKEIELELLEKDGRQITETDTGDYIVKLVGETGVHQVIPAMHITPKQISEAIKRRFKKSVGQDPAELTGFIAGHVRKSILEADAGITGANAITANGEVLLLENEGNISLVTRVPKKHIIVAGIEKIVPTLEDAMHVVKCATIWGSGRRRPIYVSIISGPSSTADIGHKMVCGAQGASEVTLILVDNGRRALREKSPEILYCINCGACNNLCPAYRQVLGFFGKRYPGPKGIVYAALEGEGKQNYLCNLCDSCRNCCPARINLPEAIRKARGKLRMESDKGMIGRIRQYGNPFGKLEKGKTPDKLYCC